MADVTIDGVELTFDLEKITITEHRALANSSTYDDKYDGLIARVIDKPIEWIGGLSQTNYRRLLSAYFKKAREPLSDPN